LMIGKILPVLATVLALAFCSCRTAGPAAGGKEDVTQIRQEFSGMRNVCDFGAVGDGRTKDTAAIQRAIDAGGMVYFPPGVYVSGTLYLKSNGGLHLGAGAVLLASPDKADYNADDFCPQNAVFAAEKVSGAHFIVAVEQENVTIEGPGRIDGNRQAFFEPPAERGKIWSSPIAWRPGQMIFLCECTNVRVQQVELFNAPYWTCFFHGCECVQVTGVHIYNHPYTRNGDGLDIDSCRFVTVSDCIIDSGDDCIALRGNPGRLKKPRPCEHITITNCILKTICNAFRIGVGDGVIRNVVISNCIIHGSRTGVTLCSKYSPQKGVLLENIQFENLRIDAQLPIAVLTNAQGRHLGPALQPIRDISFRHIRGSGCSSIRVVGYAEGDIRDITFSDVIFDWLEGGNPDSGATSFGESAKAPCPDAPVYLECADRVSFENVRIRWKTADPRWKYGLRAERSSEVELHRSDFGKTDRINGKITR